MVQMNWFAGGKLRHRCREQTYGHQGGKAAVSSGGGVMDWEIGIDIYTLIGIKWISNKNLLYKKINKIKFKNSKKKWKPYIILLNSLTHFTYKIKWIDLRETLFQYILINFFLVWI